MEFLNLDDQTLARAASAPMFYNLVSLGLEQAGPNFRESVEMGTVAELLKFQAEVLMIRSIYTDRKPCLREHLNPNRDLISQVRSRLAPEDHYLANAAKVWHGVALLAEGFQLTDAVPFNYAATQIPCQAI